MDGQTILYLVPYLISLAISGGVAVFAWRRRAVPGARPFALVALFQALWTLGYVLELLSPSLSAKVFWDDFQFVTSCAAPMTMLAFGLEYTGRSWPHPRRTWALLSIVPAASLVLIFTDSLHGWARAGVNLVPGEPFPALVYGFTPLIWVMSLYAYGVYLAAVSLLVQKYFRAQGFSRAQTGTVILGTLVPVLGTLLTLFDFAPTFHRDTTPFTFAIGNLIITWGLFNYRLFDLVPIARDIVLDTMEDPVVVIDAQNRVLDINPAALTTMGIKSSKVLGRSARQAFEAWSNLVEHLWDVEEGGLEIELDSPAGPLFYELQVSPLRDLREQVAGRLIVAHDVTKRKRAERKLQQAHDDLESRVQARTAELQATNERLQAETTERKQAEGAVVEGETRYRTLVENLPIGVYQNTPGPEGKLLMVNAAFRLIFGLDPDQDLSDMTVSDFYVHSSDRKRFSDLVLAQGRATGAELHLKKWDGTPIWGSVTARVVASDDTGEAAYFDCAIEDISERKRAQEALQLRTAQLETVRQVGLDLSAQLDLDSLLHSIVSRAVEAIGAAVGSLYLLRPEHQALEVVVLIGADPSFVGAHLRQGEGLAGKVWETGKPLSVDDYRNWPGRAEFYDDLDFRATIGVPIRWGPKGSGSEFLGVLDMVSDRPAAFRPADVELLSMLATQAALAILNARLFQAERQQRELAEVLRNAAQAIASSLDLDAILSRVLAQLHEIVVYDTASVLVLRSGDTPDLILGTGYTEERMTSHKAGKLLQYSPILHKMAHDLETVILDDVRQAEGWIWVPGAEHVRSFLAIPLVARRRMIGALMMDHSQLAAFAAQDAQNARALAQHAAQALENALLYEEILRANQELALLNRVIAASVASDQIETLLQIVCHELAQTFQLPQAVAALLTEDKTHVRIVADYSPDSPDPSLLERTVPVGGVPAFEVLMSRQAPLTIHEAPTDHQLDPIQDIITMRGAASMLLVPLLVEGQVMGGLALGATEHRPFTADEVDLVQRVADQASGALARSRLEAAQHRLSAAVEQAAEAIVITDASGGLLYVNPSFEAIAGFGRDEILGETPHILSQDGADNSLYGEMWQSVSSGQVWKGRLNFPIRDGSEQALDMTVSPVRDQSGQLIYFVGTMRDVTREVELESQAYQAQKMEALGRLAGGIAHDFNNLLTVVNLSARLLEQRLHPQDPLWEHVQHISNTSHRASALTQQLLRFSRREIVKTRVLDLNVLIAGLAPMLQRLIGETIALQTDLLDELWPVEADPSQVEQMIVNLAVNARDAMPRGGVLTIASSNMVLEDDRSASQVQTRPGEYVLLSIADTGQGMDDDVKARVFEPFFTTKERGRGTGLGLASVFGTVSQAGGHIRVDSTVGKGSTFSLYWPRSQKTPEVDVPDTPIRADAVHQTPTLATGGQGAETLLIVEDEPAVRELTTRVLESYGYRVLVAGDALQALQMGETQQEQIDLLLTDVVLPQMSGQELAGRLLPLHPAMRVMYMSGYADDAALFHGELAPETAFLPKPFTIEALTAKVRETLAASPVRIPPRAGEAEMPHEGEA